MKKFLLSTLLFIGGILGSIQAEGPVFQWAKSLDGNPGNGGDNAHSLIKSRRRKNSGARTIRVDERQRSCLLWR